MDGAGAQASSGFLEHPGCCLLLPPRAVSARGAAWPYPPSRASLGGLPTTAPPRQPRGCPQCESSGWPSSGTRAYWDCPGGLGPVFGHPGAGRPWAVTSGGRPRVVQTEFLIYDPPFYSADRKDKDLVDPVGE